MCESTQLGAIFCNVSSNFQFHENLYKYVQITMNDDVAQHIAYWHTHTHTFVANKNDDKINKSNYLFGCKMVYSARLYKRILIDEKTFFLQKFAQSVWYVHLVIYLYVCLRVTSFYHYLDKLSRILLLKVLLITNLNFVNKIFLWRR